MKLYIKKEYLDLIKKGLKIYEFRDAHITFICLETGERLRKNIIKAKVFNRPKHFYPDVLEDDKYVEFALEI